MNTPAHLAASLFAWRNETGWPAATAVAVGAVLPDAPMFVFYGFQKVVGRPEREIWSTLYFDERWQLFFDVFNSIPLFVLIAVVCHFAGFRVGTLLALSALLHCLCDLPLHHDDAHRHFLPFTNWRFASPVSYWDPRHFGRYVTVIELMLAVSALIVVAIRGPAVPMQRLAYVTLGLYVLGVVFVLVVWLPTLGSVPD